MKVKVVFFFMIIGDIEFILSYFKKFNMKDYVFIVIDYYVGCINRFNSLFKMLWCIVGVILCKGNIKGFENFFYKVLKIGKLS